ncbi:hypothetical protein JCM9279_006643 [Rhodotorula babjevae]
MHRFLLVVLALAFALITAAAEVTEQFVLGDWTDDPETLGDKLTAHAVKYEDDDGAFWACSSADEPAEQAAPTAQAAQAAQDMLDLLAGFAKGYTGQDGPDEMGGVWTRRIVKG